MEQRTLVLMYHQIIPEGRSLDWCPSPLADPKYGIGIRAFARQMLYLRNAGFLLISLKDWMHGDLPPDLSGKPAVMITFDDGYTSDFDLAAPVLADLGIPSNFFISTGYLGKEGMLTDSKVHELSRNPLFYVGAHGESHRFLTSLTEEECLVELTRSIARIRLLTGIRETAMSAPGGRTSPFLVDAAKKTGFWALMTSRPGLLLPGGDLFSIPRLPIMQRHSQKNFEELLDPQSWVFHFDRCVRSVKQRIRGMLHIEKIGM